MDFVIKGDKSEKEGAKTSTKILENDLLLDGSPMYTDRFIKKKSRKNSEIGKSN